MDITSGAVKVSVTSLGGIFFFTLPMSLEPTSGMQEKLTTSFSKRLMISLLQLMLSILLGLAAGALALS